MTAEGKLTSFEVADTAKAVEYVETQTVKDGVECDIYSFVGDQSRDLAIVRVKQGFMTPLQRVLLGVKTIEGFVDGEGALTVTDADDNSVTYDFKSGTAASQVVVGVGDRMQWHADGDTDLTFYEICEPPYADGRFENLPE